MEIYVECPHCEGLVEIIKINCGIFRHGIYKNSKKQLNPHASQNICEDAVSNDKIYGCGKPFRIEFNGEIYVATKCAYI